MQGRKRAVQIDLADDITFLKLSALTWKCHFGVMMELQGPIKDWTCSSLPLSPKSVTKQKVPALFLKISTLQRLQVVNIHLPLFALRFLSTMFTFSLKCFHFIKGILLYVTFWEFSLNIVLLRFIHIVACHCNLFVLAAIHHPLF